MASADLELCYLTATEALARFRARTLSPLELLDALIARSEDINPQLNALTYTFYERARAQAKKAEAKYQSSDGRPRASQHGVGIVNLGGKLIKGLGGLSLTSVAAADACPVPVAGLAFVLRTPCPWRP